MLDNSIELKNLCKKYNNLNISEIDVTSSETINQYLVI